MRKDSKPVRKITSGSRGLRSAYPSQKNNRMVFTESSLERDCCILLEFDGLVDYYTEQPITIRYNVSGKEHSYTPDFFVYYKNEAKPSQLIEIKFSEELSEKYTEYKARFEAASLYAEERNWAFTILTEKDIRTPLLENANFLLRYQSCSSTDRIPHLLKAICHLRETTPKQLLEVAFETYTQQGEAIPVLWYLIRQGQIGCDFAKKITMESIIWHVNLR